MLINSIIAPIVLATMATADTGGPLSIIPLPVKAEVQEGEFALTEDTAICHAAALKAEADFLARALEKSLGQAPQLYDEELCTELDKPIVLNFKPGGPTESYSLEVGDDVQIAGADAAGVFYGIQSLLQLIPLEDETVIPKVYIEDHPRFSWRGMHLDVGRHMFDVADIKKFIDWLALHKFNTFHWHLTEDQGWRIEIKKYPALTKIGAYRASTPPYLDRWGSDGKRYGGYYTQEEIKDLVAYAEDRHITIVPEIDMPGHMSAAIASYPWLGNDDIEGYAPKVQTKWGVHPYVLAPKEETFQWVDDVLAEVCELFPSKYIHIGGDEAPKKQWKESKFAQYVIKREGLKDEHELQSYFIRRVEKMLEKRDRKLIGWDEIREGGLSPNATMMLWRGWHHAIASVNEGHDVVMAPGSHTYFDHYQNLPVFELEKGPEYECIGGYRTIESVYSFNPVPKEFQGTDKAKHILGCQAQLWSEYMKTWDKVEYQAFPRVSAIAEVAWSPQDQREFKGFMTRLRHMMARYEAAGLRHFDPFNAGTIETRDGAHVTSSMKPTGGNLPGFAVDGDPKTHFWSNRGPKDGDHFTVTLGETTSGRIGVMTGGEGRKARDFLRHGVLEVSTNGKDWQKIAAFKDGKASGVALEDIKHIRIRVTGNQYNWLIISEITFK